MPTRLVTLCAALTAGTTAAQAPDPPAPTTTTVLTGVTEERPHRPNLSTDLLLGLPIAVRVRGTLDGPLWAEAGVGLWVIIPDLFAGLRWDVGLYRGRENAVSVRPGVAAHAIFNPFHGGGGWFGGRGSLVYPGVGADVDLVWEHGWTDRVCGQVGLKVGGVAVFGRNVGVIPVAALLFGVQF